MKQAAAVFLNILSNYISDENIKILEEYTNNHINNDSADNANDSYIQYINVKNINDILEFPLDYDGQQKFGIKTMYPSTTRYNYYIMYRNHHHSIYFEHDMSVSKIQVESGDTYIPISLQEASRLIFYTNYRNIKNINTSQFYEHTMYFKKLIDSKIVAFLIKLHSLFQRKNKCKYKCYVSYSNAYAEKIETMMEKPLRGWREPQYGVDIGLNDNELFIFYTYDKIKDVLLWKPLLRVAK